MRSGEDALRRALWISQGHVQNATGEKKLCMNKENNKEAEERRLLTTVHVIRISKS